MDTTTAKAMICQVTVVTPGASSSSYNVGPHAGNFVLGTSPAAATLVISEGGTGSGGKKKRGRPRKYKSTTSTVFSPPPMPLSSSSADPPSAAAAGGKSSYVGEKQPSINSERKYRNKIGAEKLDEWDDCLTGSSFLPHVITVNTGEDISAKIMEFSLQGPRSVCVLCGNGTVSNVTIRHPSSSGATFTYEGLFEILSFTGSFNPVVEIADPKSGRSCGTMTISLAGADGRVVGGFIGGLTIAASPIKVIVASFLLGSPPLVLKPKKQKMDGSGPNGPPAVNLDKRIGLDNNTQGPTSCSTSQNPTQNPTTTNWEATQIAGTSRKSTADINISLQG